LASIDPHLDYAMGVVQHYIGSDRPLAILGYGVSGAVFKAPDLRAAFKVHRSAEGFATETAAYRRLAAAGALSLHGLVIPQMISNQPELRLLQLDIVAPPFLLDFAGVHFSPPDYSVDVMNLWRADIDRQFGLDAWLVHLVHDSLAKLGIYYMDIRPSNINLKGHPQSTGMPLGDVGDNDL
jgi:hypothetical protein